MPVVPSFLRRTGSLLAVGLLLSAPAVLRAGDSPALTALLTRANAEAQQRHFADAATLFHQAEKLAPNHLAVLLGLSRQYSDLFDGDPKNESLARKCLAYAERAVSVDPKSSEAHLRLAVASGKLTDFVSNKRKMEISKVVKDETERAVALDPKNDFAWYVLGRWHQEVAEVNGVLKAIAKIIYGGLPPASREDALKCFQKADALLPNQLVYHSGLARAYTALGRTAEARTEWAQVVLLPPIDEEERTDVAEARKVLGK